jgi:type III secretory pathway lipoprotein EscJ
MRSHLTLVVLVGLLFCSLAAIEIPELVNLTDDTSNDYTVIVSQSRTTAVKVSQQSGAVAIAVQSNPISEYSGVARSFDGATHRSHGVLHLCCVQRT